MSNPNVQLDGLGSFNQAASNSGTIKFGAFSNASRNYGTVALSAVFNNTSQNRGVIGDIIPITTASLVQQFSGNWTEAYNAVVANSAVWVLSGSSSGGSGGSGGIGDATNAPTWDAVATYIQANSASLVFTTDSRLTEITDGTSAFTYLQAHSADFIFTSDSRLSDSRTPVSHVHDASEITTGKIDAARLPILPSQEQVLIQGVLFTGINGDDYHGGIDSFTYKLSSINQGTLVTTTDGFRWVYTGDGDKRYDSSYVKLADITPDWDVITNKPTSFPTTEHGHNISAISGLEGRLSTIETGLTQKQASGDYALNSDSRFTTLASNSAQWGNGTVEGHTAYTFVQGNSGSLVYTSDSRLSDTRVPKAHTQSYTTIDGLESFVDDKIQNSTSTSSQQGVDAYTYVSSNSSNLVLTSDARLSNARTPTSHVHGMSDITGLASALTLKANASAVEDLTTFIAENSGTWEGVSEVYNYFQATTAAPVFSDDIRLAKASTAYSYVTASSANIDSIKTTMQNNSAVWGDRSCSINYTIDGGGSVIATGSKGYVQIPYGFTVTEWTINADILTTSFSVDVLKASYSQMPTTTSVVGGDFLTLSNSQKNRNQSASWTAISAGDFLEFYINAASNASVINITLKGTRS